MQQSALTSIEAMDELHLNYRIDVWETLADFSKMPKFPLLKLYQLSKYYMEYSLYEQTKRLQQIVEPLVDVRDMTLLTFVLY